MTPPSGVVRPHRLEVGPLRGVTSTDLSANATFVERAST
jgi:hypothetical protein